MTAFITNQFNIWVPEIPPCHYIPLTVSLPAYLVNTPLLNKELTADYENTKPNCFTAILASLGYLSCCCSDKIPDKSNIKKKGFILVHRLREWSIVAVIENVIKLFILHQSAAEAVCQASSQKQRAMGTAAHFPFSFLFRFGTPAYKIVPLTLRACLPTSINLT